MSSNTYDDTETEATPTSSETAGTEESTSRLELRGRLELLAAENRRLREEYTRAKQSQYRRSALGMGGLGVVAVTAGVVFPGTREVLFIIGAIGLFGALLTYYLTPERFVPATVGEQIYATGARNYAAMMDDLGLTYDPKYLPTDRGTVLYLPAHPDANLSEPLATSGPYVLEEDSRGLLVEPVGEGLLESFESALGGELADQPALLIAQLCDGIVEQFELADSAVPDTDVEDGRLTIRIAGSVFGPLDRFDHPVSSLVACGLVAGLDQPVTVSADRDESTGDWLLTFRFDDARRRPGEED